jgi:peptide/nickel transport system substrate-binding protein
MKTRHAANWALVSLMLLALLLGGCGPTSEPETAEEPTEPVVAEATPTVEEQEVATATPEPETGPQVGGTLVLVPLGQPDTLDQQVTSGGSFTEAIMQLLGGTLVALHPETGEFVPYLAQSWTVSEDGLTYEFKLTEGVKFHNGDALTADDWVYTIERAQDEETGARAAADRWGAVESAEAVDDYTLRLTLGEPFYPFLFDLSLDSAQPVSKAAIEEWGADYGTNPVGVGPYVYEEWVTGTRVVLKRNPDYEWGPSYTHGGPAYIETIEFRFIEEDATKLAGLETGEIDQTIVAAKDLARFEDAEGFQVFSASFAGINPYVALNTTRPPFDDIRVRQAVNLAVDRESLIKLVVQGRAIPQYGPISVSVPGYWSGVEDIGYGYDLDRAKSLMAEAGWSDSDGDGILDKDGQALELVLDARGDALDYIRTAEVLQEQFRELGIDATISQAELGILVEENFIGGDFDFTVWGLGHGDAHLMWVMFHSFHSGLSCCNMGRVENADLDEILDQTRFATTAEQRETALREAQELIVEQAYVVPLYQGLTYVVVNDHVKDVIISQYGDSRFRVQWYDAYIEE